MMVKQQRMMVPGHGERGSPKIDRYGFGAYFKQVITYSDAFALREKCATPILKQDNEFICGSYRCGQSVRDALRSVFAGHNEILNVWKDKVKKKKKRLLEE
ncbi:uncharacterized protein [Aegilops tauschii subsp. strangulata]|uniref:uncharacterized protein isoform X1 n=1 Tax=Aegilops tauschii subsp. strangulata TaxID=200361 RepID=UPI001ABC6860|nr:uncharacterized protein LOC120976394 isoform X1 [Aegilops tauschii subsp. strangulata]